MSVYDELGIWLDAIKGIDSAQRAVRALNEGAHQKPLGDMDTPQYMSGLRVLEHLNKAEAELRDQFQKFVNKKRDEAVELKAMFYEQ